jgi:hypothetical protein
VNGEVHGGRPRPTGAVVPRGKKNYERIFNYSQFKVLYFRRQDLDACFLLTFSRTKLTVVL